MTARRRAKRRAFNERSLNAARPTTPRERRAGGVGEEEEEEEESMRAKSSPWKAASAAATAWAREGGERGEGDEGLRLCWPAADAEDTPPSSPLPPPTLLPSESRAYTPRQNEAAGLAKAEGVEVVGAVVVEDGAKAKEEEEEEEEFKAPPTSLSEEPEGSVVLPSRAPAFALLPLLLPLPSTSFSASSSGLTPCSALSVSLAGVLASQICLIAHKALNPSSPDSSTALRMAAEEETSAAARAFLASFFSRFRSALAKPATAAAAVAAAAVLVAAAVVLAA
mmetsp:Transcript_31688/g.57574  ORF Transcript_31688/g.57574 Transcript_31688/m.57574 type:complete len:281 (+) Transcript_31688:871-1713(+)